MVVVIALLFALAGYFNYRMDAIQFRALDPDSWKNKWKNGDPTQGEAFPFSSTVFVALTDKWHMSKWLMFSCFEIAASIPIVRYYDLNLWFIPVGWMVLKSVRGLTFSIFFR